MVVVVDVGVDEMLVVVVEVVKELEVTNVQVIRGVEGVLYNTSRRVPIMSFEAADRNAVSTVVAYCSSADMYNRSSVIHFG